jgi:hypothetical protein
MLHLAALVLATSVHALAQNWVRTRWPFDDISFRAVVTDTLRQRLVHVDEAGDTWEWDGVEWRKMAGGPPGRIGYHGARQRTILLGGQPLEHREWDGHTWRVVRPALPPSESGPAAFDAARYTRERTAARTGCGPRALGVGASSVSHGSGGAQPGRLRRTS